MTTTDGFQSSGTVHGETDHVKSTDVRRSVEVPEGVWTDVRAGQVSAEGVVTRPEWPGVLFDADDPTKVIVWHLKPAVFACARRNIQPEQVVFEKESGAPWCPTCLHKKKQILRKSKVKGRRKKKQMIERIKADQVLHNQSGIVIKDSSKSPITPSIDSEEVLMADGEIVWKENGER